MRSKLKLLEIRLTELSTYLGFSRPTLYKFLANYEKKEYAAIDYKVKIIFDFIKKKSTTSKIEVINKIIEMNKKNEEQGLNSTFISSLKSKNELVDLINAAIEKIGIEQVIAQFEIDLKKILKETIDND